MAKARDESKYGTGHDDGLVPLRALDVGAVRNVDDLVRSMGNTAFGGRRLGEGDGAAAAEPNTSLTRMNRRRFVLPPVFLDMRA